MALQVIVGAGPVGRGVARLLADRGERVRLVSRRGTGPEHPGIEQVGADAADLERLAELTEGAAALYNCANPAYHRWATDWPPIAAALLAVAERTGAVLATTGNLYGYGPVHGSIAESAPLRPTGVKGQVRAKMWQDALAAHEAGRARVTEVRGSDYLGAGAQTLFTLLVVPKVLAGKRASVPADLDAPHSWTYVGDVARTLVAAADDERGWGRPWHVPSQPPVSIRALAARLAELAGAPAPRLAPMPPAVLWLGGLFDPTARELRETAYQFRRPFVLDSSAATATFGIEPTGLDTALRETAGRTPAASR
ncbi:NAD-dependent epimerase/dehydratase family protein [Plantactinospora sp. KLBMP9567]|uniref:NAD-dependent epimerase/dehydratase family protein n=1 Tax=Plantactinospora sp. KLBMP9567 TaxID=3085900 RepID=UPI002981E46D|nr:NAD-dependent epimerase/dehydratase family protein [Plantactinospora sp. KLBMP9567]MDW5326323.1 NAD-dependent epimerase/dehydratase family protein [Plantactinospora sp. KLBMP9567]